MPVFYAAVLPRICCIGMCMGDMEKPERHG